MQLLYVLTALVATLTILANGFAQEPLIYTSINSAISQTSLGPRKIIETSKETSFSPGERKYPPVLYKDKLKKITSIEIKLLPEVNRNPAQASLMNVDSFTTAENSNPTIDHNPTKIYIKLPISEFIAKSHKRRNEIEINDSNLPQSSNLGISHEENYANGHLTSSKTKFPEALRPIGKVRNNFDQLPVQISFHKEKKLTVLSGNGKENGEEYVNTSNHEISERFSSYQFFETNHNRDSQQPLLPSRFNQPNANQSLFTIKEFPKLNYPNFATTGSKTLNSRETTVNGALNKRPEDGKSSPTFVIAVDGNSATSLLRIVNKGFPIGEVSNLFLEANKFQTEIQNGIDLPTLNKNLMQEVNGKLKSEIKPKNSFVMALLKSKKKAIVKDVLSVTQKSIANNLCKSACLDEKIEIKEQKVVENVLPSTDPEIVDEESDPKLTKNEEATLPQIPKERSIRRKLCKVLSATYLSTNKNTQLEKRLNSVTYAKIRKTPFENLKRKGNKNLIKSLFPLNYTSTTLQQNRDFLFLSEAPNVKGVRNKNLNEDFNKTESKTSVNVSLNVARTLKLDFTPVQVFSEINQKTRDKKLEGDTLKDISRIIKREPICFISKSKINYSHEKAKESQVPMSLVTWTENATLKSLKDQLAFASTFSNEESTIKVPEQYFQLKRNRRRRFAEIIFSNSSINHPSEKKTEAESDPKFIFGQIRNYALDKKESNLEEATIQFSSAKNSSVSKESIPKIHESMSGYYNSTNQRSSIDQPLKNIESLKVIKPLKINESLNINEALNNSEILKINQTTDYFNETVINDEGSEENLTKVSNPVNLWPVKHSAIVEGDLVLGGLMMVHEREDTITCGPVMPQGGVQALEAMLYTLDRLNDQEIVPGVKIGAHILDDCDKDTYGLEMAVDFIKGSISNIDGAEYHCNKTTVRKVISGVVGAASSVTSIQVANLLRLFRIPQVSFFSTSPELSNKQRFEYFTRTIPSDHYQVKAMVDIVRKMRWSYVSIIYEESNYGIKAFEELEDLLAKYQICIAIKEKLVKDSGVAEETAYDNIVQKLLTKPRARGCIIFGSDQEVAGVMRAIRRCNATGAFSWIGSDGWSARGLVSNGNEPEVEGTLSVQPQANPVKGFEEYFLNLTVENNKRNPWFVEFWEDHFQCRYPNSSLTPYNEKYTKPCTTKERLTKQNTAFEDQLQFVSDAVMAFAYAFRNMHKKLCHGKKGLCDAMRPTKGTELLQYLRNVEFEGLSGDEFKFDVNGDGPARYNIIHFKQTSPGVYNWIRVGKYLDDKLLLNMSEVQFKLGHPQPPESVCSLPCEVGQAKKYVEGERCCWHCFNCTQYQIRDPDDETQCVVCPQGTVPDETHSYCREIPEEFLRPESGWAIGAMSFSATGILMTLFVVGVFFKFNDTPVVRASGRELSYVLLSGILLCYLVTFTLILKPSNIVCGIQRFTAGFCFTVVYAALLTKTNRISRIFNVNKHSAKRPSFISPKSQLIICSGLVSVQILINGVWMIIDPARAMHHYPTREDNLLVCNSYIDASYMIAFTYPIILIVICTVYAVLTRKIPEAFNESKHIGFTMYTTCVIWLAFVPLYFGTGNHVALRITSMSVTISLSASVTIACLFSPKLYIILIRPERNVRQSMMPNRHNTTKSSGLTNASNLMAPVTLTAVTCDQNKAVKKHVITTTDCSTQSEYYEMESVDKNNGKPPSLVSRSTQTLAKNNEGDSNSITSGVSKETNKDCKENSVPIKELNTRIGNGPVNQNDVSS